jgi:hypothetical protein
VCLSSARSAWPIPPQENAQAEADSSRRARPRRTAVVARGGTRKQEQPRNVVLGVGLLSSDDARPLVRALLCVAYVVGACSSSPRATLSFSIVALLSVPRPSPSSAEINNFYCLLPRRELHYPSRLTIAPLTTWIH